VEPALWFTSGTLECRVGKPTRSLFRHFFMSPPSPTAGFMSPPSAHAGPRALVVSSRYYLNLSSSSASTLFSRGAQPAHGYAGQISLGHAAFFGSGPTPPESSLHVPPSPWLAMGVAVLLTVTVPSLSASPPQTYRLLLGMATLGFASLSHLLASLWLTGGPSGLVGIRAQRGGWCWTSLGMSTISSGLCPRRSPVSLNIVDSRVGGSPAIHDSEVAARASAWTRLA